MSFFDVLDDEYVSSRFRLLVSSDGMNPWSANTSVSKGNILLTLNLYRMSFGNMANIPRFVSHYCVPQLCPTIVSLHFVPLLSEYCWWLWCGLTLKPSNYHIHHCSSVSAVHRLHDSEVVLCDNSIAERIILQYRCFSRTLVHRLRDEIGLTWSGKCLMNVREPTHIIHTEWFLWNQWRHS